MAKVSNVTLKIQSGTGNGTLYSTWVWTKEHTKEYQVQWSYATGDGVWFVGSDSTVKAKQSTYSIPDNAKKVRVRIKPISATYKKKVKSGNSTKQVETKYWTADWSTYKEYNVLTLAPEMPSGVPTIEFNSNYTKFIASITVNRNNSSVNAATKVEFQIKDLVLDKVVATIEDTSITAQGTAAITYEMTAGHRYRVRCRTMDAQKDYSSYTDYAPAAPDAIWAKPLCPVDGIYWLEAKSTDTIELNWDSLGDFADTYEIQYTTNKRYFDVSPSNVQSLTLDRSTGRDYQIITGLDSGYTYYFRLRVQGGHNNGYSEWSKIAECILAKVPAAPTTWALSTTTIVGENIKLYWTHNAEDNSHQTWAIIQLNINGIEQKPILMKNSTDEDKRDKVREFTLPTYLYSSGAVIQWKVKTCGVLISTGHIYDPSSNDYQLIDYLGRAIKTIQTIPEDSDFGPWSITRTITVHAQPTLSMIVSDYNSNPIIDNIENENAIDSYPIYIDLHAGPSSQKSIRYYLSIMSTEDYLTMTDDGLTRNISRGDVIYSTFADESSNQVQFTIDPSVCHLENNVTYKFLATVTMNSGLTAETSYDFTIALGDDDFEVDAEFTYDEDNMVAYIKPYAFQYIGDDESINSDQIYPDVILAVYRRSYDGEFIPIETGINGALSVNCVDPHPSLDFARYRIIGTSKLTGKMVYYDLPPIEIDEHQIVIQWNEESQNFFDTAEGESDVQPYSAYVLKLPYNIDVSDSHSPDVKFVEYQGRKYPVSYYGTQLGITSSWKVEIERDDVETLYAIRRLAVYQGDVYVREPSGIGYWANVNVSYSQEHRGLTIPVTFAITRVEGGK